MPTFYIDQGQPLPAIGTSCPNCRQGFVEQGQWGPWCKSCSTGFKISKYAPRGGGPAQLPTVQEGAPVQGLAPTPPPIAPELNQNGGGYLALIKGMGTIRGDIQGVKDDLARMKVYLANLVDGPNPTRDAPVSTPVADADIPVVNEQNPPPAPPPPSAPDWA